MKMYLIITGIACAVSSGGYAIWGDDDLVKELYQESQRKIALEAQEARALPPTQPQVHLPQAPALGNDDDDNYAPLPQDRNTRPVHNTATPAGMMAESQKKPPLTRAERRKRAKMNKAIRQSTKN